jgi:hypothetical protein
MPSDSRGPVKDSYRAFMYGLYRTGTFGRRHHRTIGYPRLEKEKGFVETVNETIDASVFERWRNDPGYRPPGLVAWAGRQGVDPAALTQTVAIDGTPV